MSYLAAPGPRRRAPMENTVSVCFGLLPSLISAYRRAAKTGKERRRHRLHENTLTMSAEREEGRATPTGAHRGANI